MGKRFFYHDGEWQVAAVGILFALLGIGNLITTIRIFLTKSKDLIQN
jgi:hypothetical protein